MKRYTSRFLKSVALLYMAFPASYLLFAGLFFDVPAKQCVSLLLSPWYWVVSLLAIGTGYSLWEMRRSTWYIFLAANVLIGYMNAVVAADYGETHHKVAAFVISLLTLVFLIFRVGREVRVPYFLPRIRWWESNPRYKLMVPAEIRRGPAEGSVEGEILDLSTGGCFVKLRTDLNQDETIGIRFSVFGVELDCPGTVVWRTQSAVTHPRGVGVKFGPLTRHHRRVLKAVNGRLRQIATLYRSSRFLMNQEEFRRKMDELQNSALKIPERLKGRDGSEPNEKHA